MDDTAKAVEIAKAFLDGALTPLQTAVRMQAVVLYELACWEETGGPDGPLSSFYGAADAADDCYFLGDDVERWHHRVRDRKRNELEVAEKRWSEEITLACKTILLSCGTRLGRPGVRGDGSSSGRLTPVSEV